MKTLFLLIFLACACARANEPKKIICIEDMDNKLFSELVIMKKKSQPFARSIGKVLYEVYFEAQSTGKLDLFDVVLQNSIAKTHYQGKPFPHYMHIFQGWNRAGILIRVYDIETNNKPKRDGVAHYANKNLSMFFRDCEIQH